MNEDLLELSEKDSLNESNVTFSNRKQNKRR